MHLPSIPGLESFVPLAQTSTSVSWRAYQRSLDRQVMVKMLLPEPAADPRQVERFISVARAIARIKADAFCQILDVYSSGGIHYVVMEDAAGETLADRVQANPRLPVSLVLRYALTLADGLGKAWASARFVHRNLKPSSIHITPGGVAKLTDFGMALLAVHGADLGRMDDGMIVGTPNFLAPEQVTHTHPIDHRTDMYALGTVLYFSLTGQIPFGAEPPEQVVRSQLDATLPSPRDIRPDIPLSTCTLIERLLMKSPDHRYASWEHVATDLTSLIGGKPIRRSPLLGSGRSTLAPTVAAAVPTGDAAHPGAAAADAARSRGPGGLIRLLLWLALLCWFAALANHRVGDPWGLSGKLRGRFSAWVAAALSTPAAQEAPQQPSTPAPMAEPAAAVAVPNPAPQPPRPPPPSAIRTAAPHPLDAPPDAAFHRSLADAWKNGGIGAMQTLVGSRLATGHTHFQFRAIREALDTLESLDLLAARALDRAKDNEMDLVFQGKTRRVVPKSVGNGEVVFYFGEQKRNITLKIASITDDEKIRLLGQPLGPKQAAAVCFRLLETNNRQAARERAAQAGPLAPVLALLAGD